ncbi:DUF4019 domain-containing protein [Ramlibacter humi]|uniref:DUF4019 domain-containing protein n=1 Tax=Ramlibacter humi TaxID=2530451 RepID=A0A4Z0C9X7_9BURK|nr:DUF4019 domain-containing protein [Ramlibacter humi]TFZ07784.1 DUF4019 domain-containing protein [Ramlibacter humi]
MHPITRHLFASALLGLLVAVSAHAQLKSGNAGRGLGVPSVPAPESPAAAASAPAAPEGAAISPDDERLTAGRLAAAGWLTLLDRRDWGTAWETSAAVFRKNVPLDRWMDGIPKVRGEVGSLQDRQPEAMNLRTDMPGQPKGEYVSIVFRSQFAQKTLEEVVTTTREADGRWRVTGYTAQ